MPWFRLIAAALLIVVAACATTEPDVGPRPDYYVMRHLQKADGPDPGLNETGQAYAGKLALMLTIHPPSAIYVSTTRRARETAAPAAAQLGLTPKTYDPANTPALIEQVKREAGPVLIVGHSNTVPDIVEGLGGARPADLTEADYGDVWKIFVAEGRVEKARLDWIGEKLSELPYLPAD